MLPIAARYAVLEHFFVDHGEAVARLDVEHEVDVVLENVGEFERDAVGELGVGAAWKSEFWMVALAVRVRTSSGFSRTSLLKPLSSRVHLQCLAVRQLAFESHELAVAMRERSISPGFSRSSWLRSSGRFAMSRGRRGSVRSGGTGWSIVSLRLTTTSMVENRGWPRARPRTVWPP